MDLITNSHVFGPVQASAVPASPEFSKLKSLFFHLAEGCIPSPAVIAENAGLDDLHAVKLLDQRGFLAIRQHLSGPKFPVNVAHASHRAVWSHHKPF